MMLKNKIRLIIGIVLLSVLCVSGVLAADFRTDKRGGSVTVNQDESLSNLYTGGNIVLINSNIGKDLLVGGRAITVNGDVEDDLWAVGQSVMVNGSVGGSLRVGGSDIMISGPVKEDVIAGGSTVTIADTSLVGGDLFIAGGTILINGPVSGDVRFAGGEVIINSKLEGNVRGEASGRLVLGSQAEVVGNLKYTSPKELEIEEGGKVLSEIDFTLKEAKPKRQKRFLGFGRMIGIFTLKFLIKIISLMVAGIVLVYLLRRNVKVIIEKSLTSFWSNLGIGFAALIATPIACIILLATVIGMWLAGLVFSAYIFMVMLASLLASISFGAWFLKVVRKTKDYKIDWLTVVVGVIVLNIIALIPFVGWLIWLAFMLIGLGVFYRLAWRRIRK